MSWESFANGSRTPPEIKLLGSSPPRTLFRRGGTVERRYEKRQAKRALWLVGVHGVEIHWGRGVDWMEEFERVRLEACYSYEIV